MVFGQKIGQNPYCFSQTFDDVVFDCIVIIFFTHLIPYQNLLRLNVIFMVRKIGQLLLSRGGVVATPQHCPFV